MVGDIFDQQMARGSLALVRNKVFGSCCIQCYSRNGTNPRRAA